MADTEIRERSETEKVEDWREIALIQAGYPLDVALELSRRQDIDLHQACQLLHDKCPLETALKILR